ncbi:MAG: alpha-amylase family glycosyl hydrolase [Candidatus Gastranaerophilales bacterium]|nr:alpha-amylase family glycosyl hydrolase [Candidatus Gastranaerophilales bacterium]
MPALDEISKILKEELCNYNYHVPSLWLNESNVKNVRVNPCKFFDEIIDGILEKKVSNTLYNKSLSLIKGIRHDFSGDWTKNSTIYNIFVRLTTAYDHDKDGIIGGLYTDITLNSEGIRETGTFLKTIAILPYLKKLGINTIHLLPINSIGIDGNKGDLGSPYAIRNPYEIDKNLADPLIYLPAEEQFKAFIEAAHILEMRVVLEFVFRTASKDADWIKAHPDWFYWIDKKSADKYQSPDFTEKELEEILKVPENNGKFIPPNAEYKNIFKIPPKPEEIQVVGDKYAAKTKEGELIIPGAFADWPPNDIQPPWGDVTYLRMYNYSYDSEENYNYIAYNTIRYYDPELAKPANANKNLWTMINNIISYYQEEFGIDGVMIDMGHALPSELKHHMIESARKIDPDFAFWDENFSIQKSSRDDGYNAVIGHAWAVEAENNGFERTLDESLQEMPLPFFGTSETHNTPRAVSKEGGILYSKLTWVLNNFIPNSIPFVHSGFELGERLPVNTGLCFTSEEQKFFSGKKLPLFYKSSYNWLKKDNIIEFIRKVSDIREKYSDLIINSNPETIRKLATGNNKIIAFERFNKDASLLIIMNVNVESSERAKIVLHSDKTNYKEKLSGKILYTDGNKLNIELKKGEVYIL